jgi:hypothetical protein
MITFPTGGFLFMENTVLNPFQEWVARNKPQKQPTSKPKVELSEPELSPEDELEEAWEEWKRENRTLIGAGVFTLACILTVVFIWALAMIDISNGCFITGVC